jgi:hypothetical protein
MAGLFLLQNGTILNILFNLYCFLTKEIGETMTFLGCCPTNNELAQILLVNFRIDSEEVLVHLHSCRRCSLVAEDFLYQSMCLWADNLDNNYSQLSSRSKICLSARQVVDYNFKRSNDLDTRKIIRNISNCHICKAQNSRIKFIIKRLLDGKQRMLFNHNDLMILQEASKL